jgi:AbiV family abortive infection protein
MRSRAIKDLAQLNSQEFFVQVAEGLAHVCENAARFNQGAKLLAAAENYRGAKVLEAFAKEEAAKYLILLDAVRCPRTNHDYFVGQLDKFNQHLVKGIYAEAASWRPADYLEVKNAVEHLCDDYYLDGPNGIEWIFENWIIRQREESIYIDYVENDSEHVWITPKTYEAASSGLFFNLDP